MSRRRSKRSTQIRATEKSELRTACQVFYSRFISEGAGRKSFEGEGARRKLFKGEGTS